MTASCPPAVPRASRYRPGAGALAPDKLLALAIEFERRSAVSLAIAANVLRVLDERGVRVRDVPELSGVSREAVAMATGFAAKRSLLVVEPDASGPPASFLDHRGLGALASARTSWL